MYYSEDDSINYKKKTYQITIDPTTQLVKPAKDKFSIGKISNNLKVVTEVTIDDFQKLTSRPFSFTWFGGLMNGKICNENWQQQSLFALDFDKGLISVDDVLERLHQKKIYLQLWYTSLSSTQELIKFRVVLFLDTPVVYIQHRDNIVLGLLKLFPEADQSCKNASRFYYGGIESHILHYEPIPTQILLDNMCIELITKDGGRTRALKTPTKNTTCQLGEKRTFLYYIYRSDHISPNISSKVLTPLPPTYIVGGLKLNIKKASNNVRILEEFLNGTWLYHNELFGLATHMMYLKGGMKRMKQTMKKYNNLGVTEYSDNNFNIITYLNNVEYPPIPIYKFSPYKEDVEVIDLLTASRNIRGHIEIVEPIIRIPLNEAESLFKEALNEALQDDKHQIYLFVLPTAIGKTEALTNINATIAAPTNDLKNEIAGRMKVENVTTPDSVVFENESLNKKIEYYYRIGKPKKVISTLHDIANKADHLYSEKDKEFARKYIAQSKAATESTASVLTTHARVMHSNFVNNTIVFDEDPIKSLIEIKQMDLSDLFKIKQEIHKSIEFNNVFQFLETAAKGVIYKTPTQAIDIEQMIENLSLSSIETNIFDFFGSDYFIKDNFDPNIIHYVTKRKLPQDKKIIILSATLPIFIYQKLFGDKLKIVDIRDVEQVGEVVQHTNRSCSRNALNRYVDDISSEIGDKPVLTFKSFAAKFKNPITDMYFGNCSGYDTMKGKDMAVVGTPHRNNVEYLLTAKVLDIDLKTIDTIMTYQKIEHNGFKFMFNSFDHEELRAIQLALIESDLVQAVGRARTLRENAKVNLYSNFPLRIATKFIY